MLTQKALLAKVMNHPMRIGLCVAIRGGQIFGPLQDVWGDGIQEVFFAEVVIAIGSGPLRWWLGCHDD